MYHVAENWIRSVYVTHDGHCSVPKRGFEVKEKYITYLYEKISKSNITTLGLRNLIHLTRVCVDANTDLLLLTTYVVSVFVSVMFVLWLWFTKHGYGLVLWLLLLRAWLANMM